MKWIYNLNKTPSRWSPTRLPPIVFYVLTVLVILKGAFFIKSLSPTNLIYYQRAWVAAGLSALVFVSIILWLDRNEREPWRLLLVAFLWGALATPLTINTTQRLLIKGLETHPVVIDQVSEVLRLNDQNYVQKVNLEKAVVNEIVSSVIKGIYTIRIGPFLEEFAKGLVLFAIFLFLPHEFDGILDGLIYGALVGLGFAMVENARYLYEGQFGFQDENLAVEAFWRVVDRRIFFHGLTGHAMYTGLIGAGLGLARTAKREWLRRLSPPTGFALAVIAHMMWNSLNLEPWWESLPVTKSNLLAEIFSNLSRLVLISGPFVIVVLSMLLLAWQREHKVLEKYLPAKGQTMYSETEIMRHGSRRRKALWQAFRDKGWMGYYSAARLQKLIIEWAFVRWHWFEGHLAEGLDVEEIERDYQNRVLALVEKLN